MEKHEVYSVLITDDRGKEEQGLYFIRKDQTISMF